MTHVVAYSGGLSSFEVARLCVEQFGREHVECVFTDTLTEDEDLYRFLADTLAYLGCAFTHLCYGKDIWDVFHQRRFHGNSRVDTCSEMLKRNVFRDYLKGRDPAATTLYYGIGGHEKHRIVDIRERWLPFAVEAPLTTLEATKDLNKVQLLEHLTSQCEAIGIAIPRLYDMGFEHNNCGGFCVKSGQRQMAHLLKVMPTRYGYHEEEQERLFAEIGKHGFIKRTTKGVTEYMTLREFREWLEAGGKPQLYQDGACACFA